MLESYKLYWKNYVNFSGRTPRRGYWWVILWTTIIILAAYTAILIIAYNTPYSQLDGMLRAVDSFGSWETSYLLSPNIGDMFGGGTLASIILIALAVFNLANIIPYIALSVRRLHDTGRRWHWILICYAPYILLVIVYIVILSGSLYAVVGLLILTMIVGIITTIIWIVLMCLPTSPNAIGISTHDGDGYGKGIPLTGGSIVGISGMYANFTFPIRELEEISIGRDAALSHIVIDTDAEKISRQHLVISYDDADGMYTVTDFSSNGTYLNDGTRLTPNASVKLDSGSIIYLAKPNNSFRLA